MLFNSVHSLFSGYTTHKFKSTALQNDGHMHRALVSFSEMMVTKFFTACWLRLELRTRTHKFKSYVLHAKQMKH